MSQKNCKCDIQHQMFSDEIMTKTVTKPSGPLSCQQQILIVTFKLKPVEGSHFAKSKNNMQALITFHYYFMHGLHLNEPF